MHSGIVWAVKMIGSIACGSGDVAMVVGASHGPTVKKMNDK
jgi:hypothetical protein